MLGFIRGFLMGAGLIAAGWFFGSIYPAPEQFTGPVKERSDRLLAKIDLSPAGLRSLRASLSPQQYATLTKDAAQLAASSGNAVIVERDEGPVERSDAEEVEPVAAPAAATAVDQQTQIAKGLSDFLDLCPKMTITNAPPADPKGHVLNFKDVVNVNGVKVATDPTEGGACLSSMVGQRNGRLHKGTDYYSPEGGEILAAGDGVVVEKKYRDDYGNMLLIDHGKGVYTRYAHLSSFATGMEVGQKVTLGQEIGLMGNTASYKIPVHLHYELLLGDYANPKGSFGLTPRSPFEFPKAS